MTEHARLFWRALIGLLALIVLTAIISIDYNYPGLTPFWLACQNAEGAQLEPTLKRLVKYGGVRPKGVRPTDTKVWIVHGPTDWNPEFQTDSYSYYSCHIDISDGMVSGSELVHHSPVEDMKRLKF